MGFSDHIPLKLSDGTESDFRIPEYEGKAYCDEIKNLREKYKDKIDIYVAHPDIFNFVGDNKIYQEEMRKLCIASRELNVPLEINFLGIRENRNYPTDAFWQVAGEEQAPVTFGFDAHDVESAFDVSAV